MNAEDYYLKYGVTPMNTKYDKDAKIFDYFTLIDFAEQYAEAKIKALSEPTAEADTSKKANELIPVVSKSVCPVCARTTTITIVDGIEMMEVITK